MSTKNIIAGSVPVKVTRPPSPVSLPVGPPPRDEITLLADRFPNNRYLEIVIRSLMNDPNGTEELWNMVNGKTTNVFPTSKTSGGWLINRYATAVRRFPACKSILKSIAEWSHNVEELARLDRQFDQVEKIKEAIWKDGQSPVDVLDCEDPRWVLASMLRHKENSKLINFDHLRDLYRRNSIERTTLTPSSMADNLQDEDAIDLEVDKFLRAFELLPHSERFIDLVSELYDALHAEADGRGEVVIANANDIQKLADRQSAPLEAES